MTSLRELELGGTDALLAKVAGRAARAPRCSNLRRIEEVANKRHGFCGALFHQPMPGARNDRFLNLARDVPHDHRLKRTKRLLSADSQDGHRQLHALKNFIILYVLGKRGELGEASSHSAWLRISGGKEISGRVVRLGGIASEVIPNPIEVDTLAASHESFGIRAVKIEMPNSGVQQNLLPRFDAWNRCVHYNQPLNLVRIRCRVGVSHHVSDVVRDDKGLVIAQLSHDRANVFGLRLLVVPTLSLR